MWIHVLEHIKLTVNFILPRSKFSDFLSAVNVEYIGFQYTFYVTLCKWPLQSFILDGLKYVNIDSNVCLTFFLSHSMGPCHSVTLAQEFISVTYILRDISFINKPRFRSVYHSAISCSYKIKKQCFLFI